MGSPGDVPHPHLDPLDAGLDAQLLHQLPGLSYVVSGGHSLPSAPGPAQQNPGKTWENRVGAMCGAVFRKILKKTPWKKQVWSCAPSQHKRILKKHGENRVGVVCGAVFSGKS